MVDAADLSPNLYGILTIGYLGRCSVLKWSNLTTLDVFTIKIGVDAVALSLLSAVYIP